MSNGVSKRKACQFAGITRRCLDLPLNDKGDDRMKESILAFWRANVGCQLLHSLLLKVFPGINIIRTYGLWMEPRLGTFKRYRKKRIGTPDPLCSHGYVKLEQTTSKLIVLRRLCLYYVKTKSYYCGFQP